MKGATTLRNLWSLLAMGVLMLSLAACAGSPTSEGCCGMCAGGGKAEAKEMKCDKKDKAAGCCSKGAAEGKSAEGHQH